MNNPKQNWIIPLFTHLGYVKQVHYIGGLKVPLYQQDILNVFNLPHGIFKKFMLIEKSYISEPDFYFETPSYNYCMACLCDISYLKYLDYFEH